MARAKSLPKPIGYGLIVILALTGLHIYVYQAEPFPAPWNGIYLNWATILPAITVALMALRVYSQFQPQDAPRRVWLYFSLAWASWAVAEFVWFVIFFVYDDVPTPSPSDFFWLLASIPFTLAFVCQYRIIYQTSRRQELVWVGGVAAGMLGLGALGTTLLGQVFEGDALTWGQTFLNVFYTVNDLAIMIASLGLVRLFGRGMWGRTWWGLLALVFSDVLYTYVSFSGMYAISMESGNLISLAVDTIYALAYMLVALAVYNQYLLVRYGPSLRPVKPDLD